MRKLVATLLLLLPFLAVAETSDETQLQTLLDRFLAGAASDPGVHSRFWADDLIYTSSSGQRFGKRKIMEGMKQSSDAPVTASYRAEEVDIRLFGDTAVVAFQLIGEESGEGQKKTSRYYNTGTFLKRNGQWQAVAWQATRIPD